VSAEDRVDKTISRHDPDFQVVELPGSELLVGSSNVGFETVSVVNFESVSVVGNRESLIVRAARMAAETRRCARQNLTV